MAEKQVSQFPQEFFDAWDLAQAGRLRLTFPERKQAVNFRHRLYSFRSKLRKEMLPAPCAYDGIELTINQSLSGWILCTGASLWREQIQQLKAQASGNENATNSEE